MNQSEYEKVCQSLRQSLEGNVNQKLTPELATGVLNIVLANITELVEPEPAADA